MNKRVYVYQLALRRADDTKKQFIIERDMITAEHKLDIEKLEAISKEHSCDVQALYIGTLTMPKEEQQPRNVIFHDKDMIEAKLNEWNSPKLKEVK